MFSLYKANRRSQQPLFLVQLVYITLSWFLSLPVYQVRSLDQRPFLKFFQHALAITFFFIVHCRFEMTFKKVSHGSRIVRVTVHP